MSNPVVGPARRSLRMLKRQMHEARLKNFNKIIEVNFEGNVAKVAKALDRSHTFVWQIVNKRRTIGEGVARHIEKCVGLATGGLDNGLLETNTKWSMVVDGVCHTWWMVPGSTLVSGLKEKTGELRPCPVQNAGGDVIYVEVLTDLLAPLLREGEAAFINPIFREKKDLIPGKVYAVALKRKRGEALLRIARRREDGEFEFVTKKANEPSLQYKEVKVIGKLIAIQRDPP